MSPPGTIDHQDVLISYESDQKGVLMSPKPMDGQIVALALMLMSPQAIPADAETRIENPQQESRQIYGSQLMSAQERREFNAKMRSLKTQEEQQTFRLQHQQRMQLRARAQGINLLAEAPRREAPTRHTKLGAELGTAADQKLSMGSSKARPKAEKQ